MGKGSCKNTKVSNEKERDPTRSALSFHDTSIHEPERSLVDVEIVEDAREDQNKNLIEYQEMIATNTHNKSLTKIFLTKEMAVEMVNIRTQNGDGLGNCVYVNVKSPNARFPYAVSADCYNAFANFFSEVISEVHGDPQDDASLIPQFGNLELNAGVDLNSYNRRRSRVMYTEIVVRRNLENINFTPTITSGERKKVISQVEDKLRELLQSFEEEAIVPQMWDNRIDLIKNDLDECGTMRDYPDDRLTLVFKNSRGVYEGCVLNFDDHVQYIVSTNDGRLGEIFKEMHTMLTSENMAGINYAAHPVYGHLTLSPEYVGTGMNIRVCAKFPYICRLADINNQIEEFNCYVENETPKETSGILILTNKKTLNTIELVIFKEIIMAFNKLCQLEDELEATTAMAVQDDAMSSENLFNLYLAIKETDSMSYTKKLLTEAMVYQYEDIKTNFGSTFNNCIRHNAYYPRSLYPRACDSNCYLKFSRFYDPILLDSNSAKAFSHAKRPTYGSTLADTRYKLRHPLILSYRVRFNRNFEKFPFPMMMSAKDRADVERLIVNCFDELPVELEGDYCPLKSIKESIHFEDFLNNKLIPNFCEVDMSAGFYRDWPKNRGIFVVKKNKAAPNIMLVVLINVIDHIKVISIDPTGKYLHICYERAICLMKHLDLKFDKKYAKKSGYGYLTSVPCFVGCAMRISGHLKLKHLGDKRERFEKECIGLELVYRGTNGHGTVADKNVFDLSLRNNLNVTEHYILMTFIQRLKEIINIEREYDSRIPRPCNDVDSEESDFDDNDETDKNITRTATTKSSMDASIEKVSLERRSTARSLSKTSEMRKSVDSVLKNVSKEKY